MIIGSCTAYLRADYVNSLKEKRHIVKSLVDRIRGKFNVSIAEVDRNDFHKEIVLGFVCLSNDTRHVNSMLNTVVNYIESNTDAELINYQIEIF